MVFYCSQNNHISIYIRESGHKMEHKSEGSFQTKGINSHTQLTVCLVFTFVWYFWLHKEKNDCKDILSFIKP